MATYKGISKQRQALVDRLDNVLAKKILKAQGTLLERILTELSANVITNGGVVTNSAANIARSNMIVNSVFQDWVGREGLDIAQYFGQNIFNIADLNKRYYQTFLEASKVSRVGDSVLDRTLAKYGVNPDGTLNPSGYLYESVSDPSIARRMKSLINGSVQSETKLAKLQSDLRSILGRTGAGIVETKLSEAIPNGLLQVDRDANTTYAVDLDLNYAIYQGGVIKTTRPFCDERNNKVFTRDEIIKFGTSADQYNSYTNKSQGEFQGKNKGYNPLVDVGGYNCRHGYDWISYELAVVLRPDLMKAA